MVHRDIKPGNVMLLPDGRVKVVDFGIARAAGSDTLTGTGVVFGSTAYLSPEQASGGSGDERSDLYALGCVLYEMLTGEVPFRADTPIATMYELGNALGDLEEELAKAVEEEEVSVGAADAIDQAMVDLELALEDEGALAVVEPSPVEETDVGSPDESSGAGGEGNGNAYGHDKGNEGKGKGG